MVLKRFRRLWKQKSGGRILIGIESVGGNIQELKL
jgi:hypothetical protein